MVYIKVTRGRVDGDVRSDSDLDSNEEPANEKATKSDQNGNSVLHESKKAN
jgi:hypothetical protein